MWDVKVIAFFPTKSTERFYLNYVGCKVSNTWSNVTIGASSFTLTMWDVKLPAEGRDSAGVIKFYLNYVGCKGPIDIVSEICQFHVLP